MKSSFGCGCGGAKAARQEWIYTDKDGKQHSYRSEIEAKAAQVRAKGLGSVRPKQ